MKRASSLLAAALLVSLAVLFAPHIIPPEEASAPAPSASCPVART
jgi:hypothetical protein